MNDASLNPLWLDRGLVQISHTRGGATPQMPQQQQLDPAQSLAGGQLDALLNAQGLGWVLESALHPPLRDRSLLLPGYFRHALEAARDAMRQAIQRQPALAKPLSPALRALEEDLALRDLAQMYRSVLHQG
jgi:type III secretion protein X